MMCPPGVPYIAVASVVTSWAVAGQQVVFLYCMLQTRVTLKAFPIANPRGHSSKFPWKGTYFLLWNSVGDAFENVYTFLLHTRKRKEGKDMRPIMVSHTWNLCSAFNPSKCTHTHSSEKWTNTHTHCEHTPGAVGSQCCSARGAVGRSVPYQGSHLSRGIEGGRERWLFTPPNKPCRT